MSVTVNPYVLPNTTVSGTLTISPDDTGSNEVNYPHQFVDRVLRSPYCADHIVFQPETTFINLLTSPTLRTATISAWATTEFPLRSVLLESLTRYESQYGISSPVMYDGYLKDRLPQVPYTDLMDWADTYMLYR